MRLFMLEQCQPVVLFLVCCDRDNLQSEERELTGRDTIAVYESTSKVAAEDSTKVIIRHLQV